MNLARCPHGDVRTIIDAIQQYVLLLYDAWRRVKNYSPTKRGGVLYADGGIV